jgi:hypothetical protein
MAPMTAAARFGLDPQGSAAPEWIVGEWIHSPALTLAGLRGHVVVVHAFQMLCPACVQHGWPQAQRVRAAFSTDDVAVIGLHTVFEHHAAMAPTALRAFLHEYRIGVPVGVDAASDDARDPIPQTMRAWGLQGTPSLLLFDRRGRLRRHGFGVEDDIALGAAIAALVVESD